MLLESKVLLSNNFFLLILLKFRLPKSHSLMMGASNFAILIFFPLAFVKLL